jgi:hypothetical protein
VLLLHWLEATLQELTLALLGPQLLLAAWGLLGVLVVGSCRHRKKVVAFIRSWSMQQNEVLQHAATPRGLYSLASRPRRAMVTKRMISVVGLVPSSAAIPAADLSRSVLAEAWSPALF